VFPSWIYGFLQIGDADCQQQSKQRGQPSDKHEQAEQDRQGGPSGDAQQQARG
jgi:hypothetical protein